uniref:(northern house mosquito) hypothetical protein n=1 Tax=Culex pipiens TaxID=7175 RepID=A0A8D8P7S2_CULPI
MTSRLCKTPTKTMHTRFFLFFVPTTKHLHHSEEEIKSARQYKTHCLTSLVRRRQKVRRILNVYLCCSPLRRELLSQSASIFGGGTYSQTCLAYYTALAEQ